MSKANLTEHDYELMSDTDLIMKALAYLMIKEEFLEIQEQFIVNEFNRRTKP